MKTKSVLIGGVAVSFVLFWLFYFIYPTETEYFTSPAAAYIDGATSPSPVTHPINP